MQKYKIINKTFSPLKFNKIGMIPPRKYKIVDSVSEEIRAFVNLNQIEIKKITY